MIPKKNVMAAFAVFAIVAAAFAGIVLASDESDAASSYSVGDSITNETLYATKSGEYVSLSGSIPGITIGHTTGANTVYIHGSGTFTTVGSYNLTLTTTVGSESFTVVVSESGSGSSTDPVVPTYSTNYSVGESISGKRLFAVGGQYTSYSGSIPGITISGSNDSTVSYLIGTGTFITPGAYTLILTTSLSSDSVTIFVSGSSGSIDFTSPDAVSGISGSSFSYQATTNVSATFSKQSSTASFLSITSSGLLTGTLPSVTSKTSYSFTIKATSQSNSSNTATQKVTIDVYPVAKITASPSNTITAKTGDSVNVSLSGNLPMMFTKSSGTWPSGISMSSTGVISGTPTITSTASVVVKGTTSEGPSQSPTITIKFTVIQSEPTLTIDFSQVPGVKYIVGSSVHFNVAASSQATITKISGPSWISFSMGSANAGSAVGSVPSSYTSTMTETITFKAVTPGGQSLTKSITITVEPKTSFTSIPTASCVITAVYSYDDNGVPTKNSRFIPELDAAIANYTFKDTLTVRGTFTGTDARTVTWDWGDGSADEGFVVDHKYAEPGLYTIKMTASNEVGSDFVEVVVQVGSDDNVILGYVIIGIVVLLLVYIIYRIVCRKGRCKSRRF